MAFSQSFIRSQVPAKCGICETDPRIKWKCIDCSKLLCNHCKEKVHPQLQNATNHQVVNIKDIGQPTVQQAVQRKVVKLNINKQYQTELSTVQYMYHCDDNSLWIGSSIDSVVQRIKPEGTKLDILSSLNFRVIGMAVYHKDNLIITYGSKTELISGRIDIITDSVCKVPSPFLAISVHITSDNRDLVYIGCVDDDYPESGRRVVVLMNQKGDHERVYEHDQHKQPIFTGPWKITSTSNGNIHVVDGQSDDKLRVVVLGQGGNIINIYTGDREINKAIPFLPGDIVTTPRDNVIVADMYTSTLHILNIAGLLMTCYKTRDINILYPCSLAFSPTGQLYIGCTRTKGSLSKEAKIYDVTISGC